MLELCQIFRLFGFVIVYSDTPVNIRFYRKKNHKIVNVHVIGGTILILSIPINLLQSLFFYVTWTNFSHSFSLVSHTYFFLVNAMNSSKLLTNTTQICVSWKRTLKNITFRKSKGASVHVIVFIQWLLSPLFVWSISTPNRNGFDYIGMKYTL